MNNKSVQPDKIEVPEDNNKKKERLAEFNECDAIIKAGKKHFVLVATTLLVVRDKELFIDAGYKTFEECCLDQWGFTKQHASRLIMALRMEQILSPMGDNGPVLPTERMARRFQKLPKEQQEAIAKAVRNGAKVVEEIKKAERQSKPMTNKPYWDKFDRAVNTVEKVLGIVGDDMDFINRLENIACKYNTKAIHPPEVPEAIIPVAVTEPALEPLTV